MLVVSHHPLLNRHMVHTGPYRMGWERRVTEHSRFMRVIRGAQPTRHRADDATTWWWTANPRGSNVEQLGVHGDGYGRDGTGHLLREGQCTGDRTLVVMGGIGCNNNPGSA